MAHIKNKGSLEVTHELVVGKQLSLANLTTVELAALTGVALGSIAFDTTLNKVVTYNGTAFVVEAGSTPIKYTVIPTAINTIPNLLPVPTVDPEFYINGILDYKDMITQVAGVVTVNPLINTGAGYSLDIDTTDFISVIY